MLEGRDSNSLGCFILQLFIPVAFIVCMHCGNLIFFCIFDTVDLVESKHNKGKYTPDIRFRFF